MKKRFVFMAGLVLTGCLPLFGQTVPASAGPDLVLFGRGMYPGDDSTYAMIRNSGFTTVTLSSFYIKANGDVYSGDDGRQPIIHEGRYTGSQGWIERVASLRASGSVRRIEILLEGRWFNQAPNTFDFIRDWIDSSKGAAGTVPGIAKGSTLFGILRSMKEDIGVDAICIDDESVYDTTSIIRLGELAGSVGMHMTLCPYTRTAYWNAILAGSRPGLVDAIYLQCYDGGKNAVPADWFRALGGLVPVYPIFLCRGAFSTCAVSHNSKSPDEIKAQLEVFKKDYPGMRGGGVWQMADIKSYVRQNCAAADPASGTATSVPEYLAQLKNSLSPY
ncbi:MAG TPA: hypothetical protein VHE54_14000 [Puia sp.]|nr:hypothetical protein [Puia sp.]